MNIIDRKIDSIRPYERNPRKNEAAVNAVAASISEFGFKVPIVVDADGVIVAGHTRYKAAQKLGMETVPCLIADDLTPEQIKAFRLADNKTAELAEWDYDLLEQELAELDFDMEMFGFELYEDPAEAVDDEYEPVLPAEPKSKRGEIYRLGRHRLMCGDSTDADDVRALLDAGEAKRVNLCITDPPYNVAVENSQGMTIQNDDMGKEAFREFLTAAFKNVDDALELGSPFYIWYAHISALQFLTALKETALSVRQQLIWVKNAFTIGRQDYQWKHEPCLYGWKEGAGHYFADDRTQATVWDTVHTTDINKLSKAEAIDIIKDMIKARDATATTVIYEDRPQVDDLHPTMKPVPLIGRFVKNSSVRDDDIIDIFGGSGSTMIACEQLGRRCFMMEYDPRYVDVIIDRWEKFTGKKAELI